MPELEQRTFQKRQIAYKVRISDILNGSFTKDEFSAGYIKLNDANVSRVNVIAALVYKSEQPSNYASVVIDDGTGKISLRSFENTDVFARIDIGDVVLIIGKIREFNNEKYIIPEILKKINNAEWINVRKLELKDNVIENKSIKSGNKDFDEATANNKDEIYSLIKELDHGDGILVDDVIKNSSNSKAEEIINKLLENGDIFEIKPGRLKVLE